MKTELVDVSKLKPHPRNYRKHPADQIEHLKASIREHGFYRNVVVAKDYTVLAGHGVMQAAQEMKLKQVPVVVLPVGPNDKRALKVVASDNEIANLAEVDDRALTGLLKEIMGDNKKNLLGTGFDDEQLSALIFTTRPAGEIADINEAREWLGLPEYDEGLEPFRLIVSFKNEKDREAFVADHKLKLHRSKPGSPVWNTRWPWYEIPKGDKKFKEAK